MGKSKSASQKAATKERKDQLIASIQLHLAHLDVKALTQVLDTVKNVRKKVYPTVEIHASMPTFLDKKLVFDLTPGERMFQSMPNPTRRDPSHVQQQQQHLRSQVVEPAPKRKRIRGSERMNPIPDSALENATRFFQTVLHGGSTRSVLEAGKHRGGILSLCWKGNIVSCVAFQVSKENTIIEIQRMGTDPKYNGLGLGKLAMSLVFYFLNHYLDRKSHVSPNRIPIVYLLGFPALEEFYGKCRLHYDSKIKQQIDVVGKRTLQPYSALLDPKHSYSLFVQKAIQRYEEKSGLF